MPANVKDANYDQKLKFKKILATKKCDQRDAQWVELRNAESLSTETLLQVKRQIRCQQNIRLRWQKFDSHELFIQCYQDRVYGCTSVNCNKQFKCVKCARSHDIQNPRHISLHKLPRGNTLLTTANILLAFLLKEPKFSSHNYILLYYKYYIEY